MNSMWNHQHIYPPLDMDGRVRFGNHNYRTKKRIPERDVHQISSINIRRDEKDRFSSVYQNRYEDPSIIKKSQFYFDEDGRKLSPDSPTYEPAGISTNPLDLIRKENARMSEIIKMSSSPNRNSLTGNQGPHTNAVSNH